MTAEIYKIAQSIVTLLSDEGLSVCTAESCTGGGIVAALTVGGKAICKKNGRSSSIINVDVMDDTGRDVVQFIGTGFKL